MYVRGRGKDDLFGRFLVTNTWCCSVCMYVPTCQKFALREEDTPIDDCLLLLLLSLLFSCHKSKQGGADEASVYG